MSSALMSRRRLSTTIAAVALAGAGLNSLRLLAQTPAPGTPAPAFEVASIKRSTANAPFFRIVRSLPGGRVTATALSLREIIRAAYAPQGITRVGQILGGPAWVDSDRFDIVAKAEAVVTGDPVEADRQRMAMLRTLLADRFHLTAHIESRELPIFNLIVLNKDGQLGPQLTRSTCVRTTPGTPPPPDGARPCAPMRLTGGGPGLAVTATAEGVTIADLAATLSNFPEVDRPVRDRTGLTRAFDVKVTWVGNGQVLNAGAPSPAADAGTGILTALPEQLGLKLDSQKGPVDVLVIDRAEKPTED